VIFANFFMTGLLYALSSILEVIFVHRA